MSFSFSFYFTPLLYIFNFISILQYITSKFKRSILLRITLLYGIYSSFIFFPVWTADRFFFTDYLRPKVNDAIFFVNYGMSLITTVYNIYVLRYLISSTRPELIPLGDGNMTFNEVSKWQRFFHRIFDLTIIAITIYPSFDYITRFLTKIVESSPAMRLTFGLLLDLDKSHYILTYSFISFYYLISEGIFNTTIGKTILNNVIVNNIAEKPSFGKRIGRTFSRLIPFEAFSFIFLYRGWHDSITETYIVKSEKDYRNEVD
ncbi:MULTISPECIES: RDD family protein [Pedobacter]|nr:RDD family protein [Pedobacter aquatilis]